MILHKGVGATPYGGAAHWLSVPGATQYGGAGHLGSALGMINGHRRPGGCVQSMTCRCEKSQTSPSGSASWLVESRRLDKSGGTEGGMRRALNDSTVMSRVSFISRQ